MHGESQEGEAVLKALGFPGLESECVEALRPDRDWAEAALAGEKRVLEMIAGGRSLFVVLDALCRVVEEICHGYYCSILLLDEEGDRFFPVYVIPAEKEG